MSRPLQIALIALAAVIVTVLGTAAVLIARFDPDTYKPQIIEAVKRATGRDLALNGTIRLKPSLWPTIQAADVAFSNPPGFSRPQMATLQSLEVQLALLPLLSSRIEIERLVLRHPDILLETDKAGRPNWQLTPSAADQAAVPPAAATKEPVISGKTPPSVGVRAVRIEDGTLAYRDDATGKVMTIGLAKLDAAASSPESPLHADADASYNGTAFGATVDTGSLSRLQDRAGTSQWPVKATLTAAGAQLTAEGSFTQPQQGKGYDLAITGQVPDAARLAPLLNGFVPPPLHDVRFATRIADSGGAIPTVSSLTLHAGASDLGAQVPGLTLTQLDVGATATADQQMKADATGRLGDQPLVLAATTGPLALLMPGAKAAPFPVDITVHAAGAELSAKGTIADARALSGASIALSAQIPDLAKLSPLARRPLPALQQIVFRGTLSDAGGLHNGAVLHGLSLTSTDGNLSGDASIGFGTKLSLTADLRSDRIDADAVQAAIDQAPVAATAQPSSEAGRPRTSGRLFSDQPLPLDGLRKADADLKLTVADLHSGGIDYKAIATHAVLTNGKLAVDPFAAELPEGRLAGTLTIDATQAAPPVRVVLHAPGLALKGLLAAAHEPPFAAGNLEVYADLRGAGESAHAIASTLDGSFGLAMAGGTIDNRLVGSLLGKVMDSLNALNLVGKGGTSELRCFGMRLDARHGVATFKALTLSSSLLTMTGGGEINLGNETLGMQLRPQARVANTGLVIPVDVSGPIRNPAVKANEIGAAEANAATVAGAVIGNATPLGIVGGLLGGDKLFGGGTGDICTPALAAARGQAVAQAAPATAAAPAAKTGAPSAATPKPGAILKNLFR